MASAPSVPVSWGELLDKITILEIKGARMAAGPGLANVQRELALLRNVARDIPLSAEIAPLMAQLRRVNETLWDVEDAIREHEAQARFGPPFVALARSVYRTNDARAALKRQINLLLDCELVEEKSYLADCAPPAPLHSTLPSPLQSVPPTVPALIAGSAG